MMVSLSILPFRAHLSDVAFWPFEPITSFCHQIRKACTAMLVSLSIPSPHMRGARNPLGGIPYEVGTVGTVFMATDARGSKSSDLIRKGVNP